MKELRERIPGSARRALVGLLLVVIASSAATAQKFMTLPFESVRSVGQGWYYNGGGTNAGIDYICPAETNILACDGGVAMTSQQDPDISVGFGRFVLIRHDNGWFTLYAHLSSAAAGIPSKDKNASDYSTWKRVSRGDVIAKSGSTGQSTGPHLHLSLFSGGYAIGKTDPYDIYSTSGNYPPTEGKTCGANSHWTKCPPVLPELCGADPLNLYLSYNSTTTCGTNEAPMGSLTTALDTVKTDGNLLFKNDFRVGYGTISPPNGKAVHFKKADQAVTLSP